MRLITLKSCEQEELFVKLHPRLMEPFSEPLPGLCGILSSILRLDKPQWNSSETSVSHALQRKKLWHRMKTFRADSKWRILVPLSSIPSHILPKNSWPPNPFLGC